MQVYSPARYVSLSNEVMRGMILGPGGDSFYFLPMNPQPDPGHLASLTEPVYSKQHHFAANSGRRLLSSTKSITGIRGNLRSIPRIFLSPYEPGEVLSIRESLKWDGSNFLYAADDLPAPVNSLVKSYGAHSKIAPAAMPIEAVRFLMIIKEISVVFCYRYHWRYLIDIYQKRS